MTNTEMLEAFLLAYDINSNAAVGFTDNEVYQLLENAQNKVLDEVYLQYGASALQGLIITYSNTLSPVLTHTGEHYCDLTSIAGTFRFFVSGYITGKRSAFPQMNDKGYSFPVDLIREQDAYRFWQDPANETVFFKPKLVLGSLSIGPAGASDYKALIYVDKYTTVDVTDNLYITYIRSPKEISASSSTDMDVRWHQKIVDKAVAEATIITSDQRVQLENSKYKGEAL